MSIDDDIALLEQVPIFAVLSHEALRVIAIGSESRALQQGEVLFREGEKGDCGYVVEEGALRAVRLSRRASPVMLERGTLIGELSLLTETRRPTTVTAAEPSSVMRIPRPLFVKMLQGYPEVAEQLRRIMIERSERLAEELGTVRHALDSDDKAQPSGGKRKD
ncbi:MAG TPA: cyclic nucleotide-binding domain-containing protein [Xanthobacteraceae bacterium]|nr:cyclic nucleotide-binding domain-containing protein [Xanthobacteraceae bacterium]